MLKLQRQGSRAVYEILCGHRYECPCFGDAQMEFYTGFPAKPFVVTPREMIDIIFSDSESQNLMYGD